MSVLKELENYLLTEIAVGLDKKTLEPDEDLLELGIIDSLGLMKLISFMEETFAITIPDEGVIPENFQNLNCMAKLVELQAQN